MAQCVDYTSKIVYNKGERVNVMTIKKNAAISPEDKLLTEKMQKIVDAKIAISACKGAPVAKYDAKLRKPYLLYDDGTRRYER